MVQLMTVEEVAQYLRFTKRTIYELLKQRTIPAFKVGNKWRFDKEAIDKWLRRSVKGVQTRILVIDDDQLVRDLFKETLEDSVHTVVTAGASAEGIQYVKNQEFDLVFLDLKMPEIDGAEVLHEIRSIRPELPVTIITGYPSGEMMERALKEGPLGVMPKPFGVSDIYSAVNSFLHVVQART